MGRVLGPGGLPPLLLSGAPFYYPLPWGVSYVCLGGSPSLILAFTLLKQAAYLRLVFQAYTWGDSIPFLGSAPGPLVVPPLGIAYHALSSPA